MFFAIGLTPLMMWGIIQMQRFGAFTLGGYERLNILATARSLGAIPTLSTDSFETKTLLLHLNEKGISSSETGISPALVHKWNGEFHDAFHHNFNEVCDAMQSLGINADISPLRIAIRGFWEHAALYEKFLRGGATTFLADYAALPLTCLAVGIWLFARSPQDRPLAQVSIAASAITGVYLATIFGSILWLHRYFVPIQATLIFLTVLSLFALTQSVAKRGEEGRDLEGA